MKDSHFRISSRLLRQFVHGLLVCGVLGVAAWNSKPQKVIFLGDSLTEGGARNNGFICLMERRLAAEGRSKDVELISKGVGGNMVRHLLTRFETDVISLKPTKVVILIGMNDVGFFTWHPDIGGTPPDQYEAGLTYMVQRLKQHGIQAIICTPTVMEEDARSVNSLDSKLEEYAVICRKVGKRLSVPVCDLRTALVGYSRRHRDSKTEKILTTDYVHLNPKGDSIVAEKLFPFIVK